MQKNRLFQIVYILLSQNNVTAGELAKRFEVSRRTIYRDIEALSGAGIPIYMSKGKGGGIHLMEHFVMNKTVLNNEEQEKILASLSGLQAISGTEGNELLSKLLGIFHREPEDWIEVNFSDWSTENQDTFQRIKEGILGQKVLRFQYFAQSGESVERNVCPLKLYFRGKTWYLYGYCRLRQDIRLFKVKRMQHLVLLEEKFERKDFFDVWNEKNDKAIGWKETNQKIDAERDTKNQQVHRDVMNQKTLVVKHPNIILKLDQTQGYRVYDEFSADDITKCEDGSYLVNLCCPVDDWLYGFLLSFGIHGKVLEPKFVCMELKRQIECMNHIYEG